ncbi:ras-associated and pleckstrin homology domains-containing protein 1 [Drosophila miranda]|uniref:ras-associated and pleckstrin homology domains-containing protein 1 n=1 Tax=Drosophila miranda TaxID=7229 RepID=UPI0007E5C50C|nr:ras-associated and pleckstrin homology domains-containing protein 1 [Drosophila miranda]
MKIFPVLAVVVLCLAAAQAGESRPQLVRLHQVTRSEYNELLRLTQGKEVVPEGRLLSSSIAGIKGLAAGVKGGFTVGNIIPAFFSSGSKEVTTKKGHPLCVISTKNAYDDEEDSRSISVAYEPNSDSSSSSSGSSGSSSGGSGHGSGHGSDSSSDSQDEDVTTVNCIIIVNGTDTTVKPSTGGSGRPHTPPPYPGGYPYYPPPYGYPSPGYYPPYPFPPPPPPPPPPPNHNHRSFDRSIEAPEHVSRLIDAYNGYYYHPREFTHSYRKRSRASQEGSSAYQPASYPQQEYASNYPKVVRNYGLTHPAPVYVRTPQFDQEQ